ncbi:hypothetical protein C8P68_10199 [Mucilaginibacter yixingensis]|uniref:Uncharacterized protein n=1 Tax=Mucilaginibacter yixingensis TaxID=1295612 RepID=A0A2T5JEK2_9SPHI|nr:hypothetical protein [Mucilaginibacter yixingensis]PTR00870.1 hypothetical protein C8P68_10199 [Mucilaginibacter yixingensis]
MFKRLSILTICLLYLVTASGFVLNIHYCLGSVRSVTMDAPSKKCAPRKMPCCKDKHLNVKVKDAHSHATSTLLSKLFAVELPRLPFEDYLFPPQAPVADSRHQRGPPDALPPCKQPIWLKNRNLRT